jgi:U3 small nucleolar RNA-associated protein 22
MTMEEINELKDTEDLYHSNLFRMQIDETLKEVKLKGKEREFIDKWVVTFRKFLQKLPNEDLTHLAKHSDYPLKFKPMDDGKKIQMSYQPPKTVEIFGSFGLETNIGSKSVVDVLVTIPNELLKRDDYLNQNFIHKKAIYLLHIAKKLEEKGTLGGAIKIISSKCDPLKPVLSIEAEDFKIAVTAVPTEDYFKISRFVPRSNNIKFRSGEESIVPTPHYNFEILHDLIIEKNQKILAKEIAGHENVKNAVKLLKIWLHQRQFDVGFHPFNGFIVTCYLVHLLKIKKIYPTMSCYQIIRLFFNHFGHSKLDQSGISLCKAKDLPNQPTLPEFHEFFELVFVDFSGYCNLLSLVSCDLYRKIRAECLAAIQMLDNKAINSFHQLFLTSIPFHLQFDHIAVIKHDEKLYRSVLDRHGSTADKIDFHNSPHPHLRKLLMEILRKGLGDRVSHVVPFLVDDSMVLGMTLNSDNAFNIVDKGPQSNEPEAEEFRKFWGGKAEIRRFKDGSITESVLWCSATAPIGEKRLITQKIVTFLLKHHFNIISDKINYIASQFDVTIKNIFSEMNETNEERSLLAIKSFDELGKELRGLDDLPLEIVGVLGVDAVFRYADVTPPLANGSVTKNGSVSKSMKGKFRAQKVLNGIIQLSQSGKWPDDLDAMRRIKGAFYIEIERKMAEKFPGTPIQVTGEYIEAMKNKLLFRLRIVHPKEVALAKEEISASNNLTKLYRTNEQSLKLEFEGTMLPKLTSSLHGLHHQFPSFGPTVAMAKRWLYSQMIDKFLWPDECTELIIAEMLLKSLPMVPAIQPQTMFIRFLHQLANFNHESDMVVVNFNEDIASEQLEEIEAKFQKARKNFPPLFIVTSCDFQNHGIWSSRAPSLQILHRVKMLAQHSIEIIGENFTKLSTAIVKDLFTPSLIGYNLVINVHQEFVKRHDVVLSNFATFKPVKFEDKPAPPADVNFVESFLGELREAFDDFAVFFYNPIGGTQIAMLWKPNVGETREFAASHVNGCKVEKERLRVNVDAIVKDIQVIGEGLISSIEVVN